MFMVFSTPRRIRILFKTLNGIKDLKVYETKSPEYLFVSKDPADFIPAGLRKDVEVKPFEGRYLPFLKNANRLAGFIKGESLPPGVAVRIISGRYEGFSGIVKSSSETACVVEISVWERIVRAECGREELEKLEVDL